MRRLALYVPVGHTGSGRPEVGPNGIARGSAIVADDKRESDSDPILAYFEGDIYASAEKGEPLAPKRTYLDRALQAAGRLRENYPTVARGAYGADELMFVGWLDYDNKRIEIEGLGSERALAAWLGYEDRMAVPPDELTTGRY